MQEMSANTSVIETDAVVIGAGLILWVMKGTAKGRFHAGYYLPVDLVGLYWHLVDLIWIFLFPLLLAAAGHQRGVGRAVAHIQHAHALGRIQLVAGKRCVVDARDLQVQVQLARRVAVRPLAPGPKLQALYWRLCGYKRLSGFSVEVLNAQLPPLPLNTAL